MALKQETIVIHRTDEQGNKVIQHPITRKENVEGLIIDLPVGHMYWSIEPNVPAGRLPAMGATYNRALYADLWAWANSVGLVKSESEWQAIASANDGNCAYYSSGDGSTTFRVPSIKCWVKGANSVDEVGSYLEAGLPNIETQGFCGIQSAYPTKGLTYEWNSAYGRDGGGVNDAYEIFIDASLSSSIYGNSDTVQPPSIVGQWLIVAFGVAHNIGEADVANVMQAVEQVQTGLGKVDGISDYIIESYRNGTEWYEVYKSGKVRQGGVYRTPSAGYINVTFLKPMATRDYTVTLGTHGEEGTWINWYPASTTETETGLMLGGTASGHIYYISCVVEGQGA